MLTNKYDKEIERLMNDEGLSHKEAMAAMKKKASKEEDGDDGVSGDMEEIALPANLLPEVSVGKEIDLSICGEVKRTDGDMVYVKTRSFNCRVSEPYKPTTPGKVDHP